MENVYRAKAGNRILSLALGLIFIGVGVWLATTALGGGITLSSSQSSGGALCGTGILILFGAVLIWVGLRPTSIAVTSEAVEMRRGKRTTNRYPYSKMGQVRMVARRQAHRRSRTRVTAGGGRTSVRVPVTPPRFKLYPEIQIEGDFSYPFILQLNFTGRYVMDDNTPRGGNFKNVTPYDSHAIAKDLASRLPSHVQIDEAVHTYAATGSPPDPTTLPEETPPMPGFLQQS
jgi:hypothetical protein